MISFHNGWTVTTFAAIGAGACPDLDALPLLLTGIVLSLFLGILCSSWPPAGPGLCAWSASAPVNCATRHCTIP